MQKKKSTASSSTSHVGAKWVGCLKDDVCVFKCIKKTTFSKHRSTDKKREWWKSSRSKMGGAEEFKQNNKKQQFSQTGSWCLSYLLRLCVTSVNVLLRRFSNTLFYFLFMDWNPTAHLNKNTQNCVELSAVHIQNFWLFPLFNNVANKCLYVYVIVFKGDHDIINYQARWPLQGFQKGRVFVLNKPCCLTKSLKRNRSR